MCSQLHMLGASGEQLVDLLLVVSHISTQRQSTVAHTHICSQASETAAADAIFILLFAEALNVKMTDFRANTYRHKQSAEQCLHLHLRAQHHS